jgi:hypothetical protein
MLILPKHSIDKKKSTFLLVLPNAYAILKSDDFKNTIFKNAIFKIALIETALPNRPNIPNIIIYIDYVIIGLMSNSIIIIIGLMCVQLTN